MRSPRYACSTALALLLLNTCGPAPSPTAARSGPSEEDREARRIVALDRAYGEADALEATDTARALTRWRAIVDKGAGTTYATRAGERIAELERRASQRLPLLYEQLCAGLATGDLDACATRAREELLGPFPGTRAARRIERWLEQARLARDRWQAGRLELAADARSGWSAPDITVESAHAVRRDECSALQGPGESRLTMRFRLDAVPRTAYLRLSAAATVSDESIMSARVDIFVNDALVAGDHRLTWTGFRASNWRVERLLRVGDNAVTVRLSPTALTAVWVQRIEVRDVLLTAPPLPPE